MTTLIDCVLGDDVRGGALLSDRRARCAPRCTVGPFTHLRPGTRLREGAKAGAFVEIKNSDDRRRARRCRTSPTSATPTSGEGTNIGAGTITANYDGAQEAPHA